jgi:membrane protein DedA with SNARE-associated domain
VLTSVAAALSSGPPPVLPGFLAPLGSPLEHYGLWAIALFVLVEDFGIPVPGETVLIAGAVFAGAGRLNIVAVGIVGFVAAVTGDNIGYAIGRFGGRALVERWGRYIFLTSERLEKAEQFFARHGGKIIVVARFIEGLRQANGIIAGITGMRWLRFVAFNALGAALWVGTWVSVGYFAGQHITAVYDAITNYSLYVAIAAVVLIAAWILFHLRKRRRARAAAPAETMPAQNGPAQNGPAQNGPTQNGPTQSGPTAADKPTKPGTSETGPTQSAMGTPANGAGSTIDAAGTAANGAGSTDDAAGTPPKGVEPAGPADEPAQAAGNGATAPHKPTRTSDKA